MANKAFRLGFFFGMLNSLEARRVSNKVRAIVRNGKIELLDDVQLPEGAEILVLLPLDEESRFWMDASLGSLDAVWGSPQDDVYGALPF